MSHYMGFSSALLFALLVVGCSPTALEPVERHGHAVFGDRTVELWHVGRVDDGVGIVQRVGQTNTFNDSLIHPHVLCLRTACRDAQRSIRLPRYFCRNGNQQRGDGCCRIHLVSSGHFRKIRYRATKYPTFGDLSKLPSRTRIGPAGATISR